MRQLLLFHNVFVRRFDFVLCATESEAVATVLFGGRVDIWASSWLGFLAKLEAVRVGAGPAVV